MTTDDDRLRDQADNRFETLFEHAPFSVQLLAPSGRTLRVNRAWEARWDPSGARGFKRYVLDEYNVLEDPQLEAKGVTPLLREAFAGRSVALPTIRYDPPDLGGPAGPRWMRAFAHPVRDAEGRVAEVMVIHEDVTARIESEQALRGSELRLKQLANTIPQLAWMADAEGSMHWYNERWYDYTGTTLEAMQGWGWQSVLDPEMLPAILGRWKHSLAVGEPFEMTFPLRGRDGRYRPFLTLVAPLKDESGRVVQWFGTNTDVSALQEAERSARTAEERLWLAMRAGNIGIWDWEIEADIVEWSDEVYALHGVAPGAFGGTAQAFAAFVHPDDREALWGRIEAAVADSDGFTADFRIVLPDGTPRWLSTWARARRDARGAHRMIGATISIDDYKKAESALREGDRLKDEFLAMLAHELRNPLAPIGSSAHLLKRVVGEDGRARRAVDIILRQMAHMTELVDDLLDVSRVTRGVIRLEATVVDLAAIVESAIEQAQPLLESRGHELQLALADRPLHANGDTTRLVQALTNLMTNAAKYTPAGGRISMRLEAAGQAARITVEDNGIGMDPAFLPHAFDLFTQSSRAPDRSIGGLGIGLALARRIVELHGGSLTAHSPGLGSGSTFVVELPVIEASVTAAAGDAPIAAGPARALRIAIVDDNVDAAQALGAWLEVEGHAVTIAYDATSALAPTPAREVDVFLLDIGLPGMDGYELAQRLRSAYRGAEFIALTGYGQAEDLDRARAAGFDHHFLKPVDLKALARVLATLHEKAPAEPPRARRVAPAAGC